jgi:hypothetical protein
MRQKITISLLIALFFICEFGFAQKITPANVMQHWIDSIQDYKVQNWANLSLLNYDYYDLCHSYKNDSLKAIAFKTEFEAEADTLAVWLQNSDKKMELIIKKLSQINNINSYLYGTIISEKFRREFYQKTWIKYANNYKKHAKENPTKYVALLLLSKQNDEAIIEMAKHNMEIFSVSGFYLLLVTWTKPSESLLYMEKYLAVADSTEKTTGLYRLFGYMAFEAKACTKTIEYLEKIPREKYRSNDCSRLGAAYLDRGGNSADTTKAVNLLLECFTKARQEVKKR